MAVYTGGRVVPSLINKDVFGFADAQLESEYRQQWLQSSLVQLRIALLLAAAMILGFLLLDQMYFDVRTQAEVAYFRLGYMAPLCAVLITMTFWKRYQPYTFHGCTVAAVTFSAYFCILAVRLSDEIMSFLFPMLVEIALFLFIMLRVPFHLTVVAARITSSS